MGAENILKIAENTRNEFLEEARKRFEERSGVNNVMEESRVELAETKKSAPDDVVENLVSDTNIPTQTSAEVVSDSGSVAKVINSENAKRRIDGRMKEKKKKEEDKKQSEQVVLEQASEQIPAKNIKENAIDEEKLNEEKSKSSELKSEIDPREKEFLAHLEESRKEFVEMDWKKSKMWDRIDEYRNARLELKSFKETGVDTDGKKMKTAGRIADDQDVVYMQALYDNALIDYKNYRIEKIKEQKLSDEKLNEEFEKLALEIGKNERISLMEAKDEIRAREMKGTMAESGKNIFKKSVDWYRGLGRKKQIALSVGLAAGAGAAAMGAAAGIAGGATLASCFAVATFGKRVLSGAVTGVGIYGMAEGGAAVLRNRAEKKEASGIVKEFSNAEIEVIRKNELKSLSKKERSKILSRELSQEERFAIVKSRMNKLAFEANDKVEKQKMNSLLRATGATFFGAAIGSGVLSHWVSEKIGLGEKVGNFAEQGKHTKLGEYLMDKFGMGLKSSDGLTGVNLSDTPKDGILGAAAVNAQEKIGEYLTIEKGSSIERTLINYYKEHGLHFKDSGHAAHIAYRDYMHDYIENHRDELIKSGKLAEYQQMLKDGMVNVKPNTEIVIDPHTGNIISIDGKLSHLNVNQHVSSGHGHGPNVKYDVPEPTEYNSNLDKDRIVQEAVDKVHEQNALETQQRVIKAQEAFQGANKDYGQAVDHVMKNPAEFGDAPNPDDLEAIGRAEEARKAAAATVENLTNAKEIYRESIKQSVNAIYKNTGYKWADIKDLSYNAAYSDDKLRPIIKEMGNAYQKEFGKKFYPNGNENFGKWMYRFNGIVIKRRLGIVSE